MNKTSNWLRILFPDLCMELLGGRREMRSRTAPHPLDCSPGWDPHHERWSCVLAPGARGAAELWEAR